MLEQVKVRCGIAVPVYDGEISGYIEDCLEDMAASGVPRRLLSGKNSRVLTAVTLYVKAYLGNDCSDTNKYLELYRKKVFRLTLEDDDVE